MDDRSDQDETASGEGSAFPQDTTTRQEPQAVEADLEQIIQVLRQRGDMDFGHYKPATLVRRINRRLSLYRLPSLEDYLVRLQQDEGEVRALIQDLLISVTDFFRDPEAFAALEARIVPALVERAGPERPLRVWVPACASGEEAYSIAMLLLERLEENPGRPCLQVFASDADQQVLNRARAGRYPVAEVAAIPPRLLNRFFTRTGEFYQVRQELRDVVIFSRHNLLQDPPFSRLDLVSCRNLLIYLRPAIQDQVLLLFHFALHPGGILFLGGSEGIGSHPELFEAVDKQHRLYRRIGPDRRLGREFTLGVPQVRQPASVPVRGRTAPHSNGAGDLLRQVLLATCTPPAAVINAHYEIQYLHGELGDYLLLPRGEPALDLIRMLRPPLRTRVRAALHRAVRDGQPVEVVAHLDEGRPPVRIRACPVQGVAQAEGLLVVTFEPLVGVEVVPREGGEEPNDTLIRQLEDELQATRNDLQSTVEELESANEELKSANEDITSANEELQSTNEELQTSAQELRCLNEELNTANRQLQDKNRELEETTNDIHNLLTSTKIATLFLDPGLRIKRFTPAATQLLRLLPADLGRAVTDFASRLPDPTLVEEARQVLDSLAPLERELGTDDGHWYIRRVLPYRTEHDHIDGVVVTYTDITRLRQTTEELDQRARQQAAVADLGLRSLGERQLEPLLDEAVILLARILEVELTKVLELLPDGSLRLVAGQGWSAQVVVRQSLVCAGLDSQAGYTLQTQAPVVVDDLAREVRFSGPALLTDHGVISGISVVIQGLDGPYGVLGVHTRQPRRFSRQDVDFVQSVANLLSGAIQRSLADRALAGSEERYRSLVAASSALVWTTGPDGTFDAPQPQWESYFGQDWEEYRGYGWLQVVHPEDRERVRRVWEQALDKQHFYHCEMRLFHGPSGSYRHYSVRAVPLVDEAAGIREWVGVITDIEERHRAEAERAALVERIQRAQTRAEAERARLHDLFMRLPALIGLHQGPDHVFTLLNEQLSRATGDRPLLGLPLAQAIPEFEDQGLLELFDRIYTTGEPWIGTEVPRQVAGSDGLRTGYFNEFHQPIFSPRGGVEGVMGFSVEVTEQVLARQALEDSQTRYRQLAESIPQIVWSVDAEGRYEYVNGRWLALTGVPLNLGEDARGRIEALVHPQDQTDLLQNFGRALTQGVEFQTEFRLRVADGSYRWFLGWASAVRDETGQVVRLLGTATDIEDQKQAQAVLAEADRQKDNFLAMLAHELRNPLAPIRNAASIMRIIPLKDARLVEIRNIIERQVAHLARLVDDLLDISRITRGRIELRRGRVNLREVVEGAVETVRPQAEQREQPLTVELPDEPLWLEGDPVRLSQILGNLLHNASKYSESGRPIRLTVSAGPDWAEIRVRDQGQGIAPEHLEVVFDLFNRLDTSLDRSSGGLGLGLTLARRLVHLHGGTLRAESSGPGRGSEFIVRLPRADARAEDLPGEVVEDSSQQRRVLVVDDNQDAAQALANLLQVRGHRVEVVHDGPAALIRVRQFKPQLVLLDIGLPEMDGYEVARQLRREHGVDLVLAAVTGYGHQEARDRSREAGFDHHFLKPVELAELDRLLRE